MARHLIMRLESPLMSFGGETIDNYGVISPWFCIICWVLQPTFSDCWPGTAEPPLTRPPSTFACASCLSPFWAGGDLVIPALIVFCAFC